MYFQIPGSNVRIMGALHVFPQDVVQLPRWASDAIAWAESYWCEMDNGATATAFEAPSELACEALLPKAIFDELSRRWPGNPPFTPLDRTPPWYAKILLGLVGVNPAPGVEHHLVVHANAQEKSVDYLETPSQLACHLGAIPIADMAESIDEGLREFENNSKNMKMLYADWSGRHLETLYRRLQKKSAFAVPSIHARLLVDRNRSWAPKIDDVLTSPRRTLIVVGALHLCGPDNLLTLLQRQAEEIAH